MKPILRDFPHSFDTERLTIRAPMPGDGVRVHEATTESQAELRQWMPWAMELPSPEEYEVNIREGHLRFLSREDLWLMILLKGTETIIGGSGLHRIDWEVPRFEIGYWARTAYVGQGYITEAVKGITQFAFETLGARRVEIRCDELNSRSQGVALRAGFTHEATLINEARHHLTGKLRNTMIFSQVRPDEEAV